MIFNFANDSSLGSKGLSSYLSLSRLTDVISLATTKCSSAVSSIELLVSWRLLEFEIILKFLEHLIHNVIDGLWLSGSIARTVNGLIRLSLKSKIGLSIGDLSYHSRHD